MLLNILFIILYILGAVLIYGLLFAMAQRGSPYVAKDDYTSDKICSMFLGLVFPLPLTVIIILSLLYWNNPFKYGLKFW